MSDVEAADVTRGWRRRSAAVTAAAAMAVLAGVLAGAPGRAATGEPAGSVRSAAASTATAPLAGRVVAIDPGHQLGNARHPSKINRKVWVGLWKACNTTGTATRSGFPEATFTWRVAGLLRDRLRTLGATVRMTRTTNSYADWGPCIDVRGRFGGRVGGDVEISIHGDGAASGIRGFFVIRPGWRKGYTDDIYRASRTFSSYVKAGLVGARFRPSSSYGGDGYDTRTDLGTLNMADVPTVLVELGNMRNLSNARCMKSATCRARYAGGLATGIRRYLLR